MGAGSERSGCAASWRAIDAASGRTTPAFKGEADIQEAEDLAQEAFARASVRWRQVRTYSAPEAWVRRVAFNLAADGRRRSLRRIRALRRVGPPPDVPGLDGDAVDLARTLGRLPLRHRQVLVLHYVAELPLEDIAVQLPVPLGTVKSRLARGRAALARRLDPERQALR